MAEEMLKVTRWYVELVDTGYLYDGQPRGGFSTRDNAHAYMERKSMLLRGRYSLIEREVPRSLMPA